MDPTATNFAPDANSVSECEYPRRGCMAQMAINFDSDATKDDGSCIVADPPPSPPPPLMPPKPPPPPVLPPPSPPTKAAGESAASATVFIQAVEPWVGGVVTLSTGATFDNPPSRGGAASQPPPRGTAPGRACGHKVSLDRFKVALLGGGHGLSGTAGSSNSLDHGAPSVSAGAAATSITHVTLAAAPRNEHFQPPT